MHEHACMHACMHACNACRHAGMQACMHACMRAGRLACMHAGMHAHACNNPFPPITGGNGAKNKAPLTNFTLHAMTRKYAHGLSGNQLLRMERRAAQCTGITQAGRCCFTALAIAYGPSGRCAVDQEFLYKSIQFWTFLQTQTHLFNDFFNRAN